MSLQKETCRREELFLGKHAVQVCLPGQRYTFRYIIYVLAVLTHFTSSLIPKANWIALCIPRTPLGDGPIKSKWHALFPHRVLHQAEDTEP